MALAHLTSPPASRAAHFLRCVEETFHAALLVGAIATPLNSWWAAEELVAGLNDCGARVLFVDPERAELLAPHRGRITDVAHMITAGGVGDLSLEVLIGVTEDWAGLAFEGLADVSIRADDDAAIFYTSGTSGRARGVVMTHRNIISAIWNTAACKARSLMRAGIVPPQPSPDDPQPVSLVSTPFFHATATVTGLIPAHLTGARLVLQRKFDAGEALELIRREGVTQLGGVPTIVQRLIAHPDCRPDDLAKVDFVGYGGAPSGPDLVEDIARTFPRAMPAYGWGMTETCATTTLNVGADYMARPGSAGAAAPPVRLRIVDDAGEPVADGLVGELEAFGPNNARGYWNAPKETAQTFREGWVRSGDLAVRDAEGFITLVDRKKDMIIRGGENVFSIEVETALTSHVDVLEAGVVGLPHPTLGESVAAVVQLRPGVVPDLALEEALRFHLAARIAAFKLPARITFTSAPLPRNANGKMLKSELKAMFEESDNDHAETGQTAQFRRA